MTRPIRHAVIAVAFALCTGAASADAEEPGFIGPPAPHVLTRSAAGIKASGFDGLQSLPVESSWKTSLTYCAVVAALGWALVNRFKGKAALPQGDDIAVVAKKTIAPRAALLVVQVRNQEFLLAQSGDRLQLITPLVNPAKAHGTPSADWDLDLAEEELLYRELRNAV